MELVEGARNVLRGIPNSTCHSPRVCEPPAASCSPWVEHNSVSSQPALGKLEATLMTQLVTHLSSKEPDSRGSGRLSKEKGLGPVSLPPPLSQGLHSRVNRSIQRGTGSTGRYADHTHASAASPRLPRAILPSG